MTFYCFYFKHIFTFIQNQNWLKTANLNFKKEHKKCRQIVNCLVSKKIIKQKM